MQSSSCPRSRQAAAAAAFVVLATAADDACERVNAAKQKQKRTSWVRPLLRDRNPFDEFNFINDLHRFQDAASFQKCTRLTSSDFEELLRKVGPYISKENTHFRLSIPAEHKLFITLKFLATGESYTSLEMLFRVSKQCISKFVPVVCDAISHCLQDQLKVKKFQFNLAK